LTRHRSRRVQVLILGVLTEGDLLWIYHVTVVRKVGVIGAALVLQGLDRSCEIDFAFEELLARNFVELVYRLVRIVVAYCYVLGHVADLHSHFLTAIGSVLLLLIEIRDVPVVCRLLANLRQELSSVCLSYTSVHRRLGEQFGILLPALVDIGHGLLGLFVDMDRFIFLRILIELLGRGLHLDIVIVELSNVHCQVLLFRMVRSCPKVFTH